MKLTWLLGAFLLCLAPALFAQDPQLKKLRDEDQAVRANPELRVARSDEDRIKLVLQLLAEGKAQTSEDKYNAAIVLQHTPADFCGKRLGDKVYCAVSFTASRKTKTAVNVWSRRSS